MTTTQMCMGGMHHVVSAIFSTSTRLALTLHINSNHSKLRFSSQPGAMYWFLWNLSVLPLLPQSIQVGQPGPGRLGFEVRTVRGTYLPTISMEDNADMKVQL